MAVLKIIGALLGLGCSLQSFFWAGQVAGAWLGWCADPEIARDWLFLVCGGNGFFMMNGVARRLGEVFPSLRQTWC